MREPCLDCTIKHLGQAYALHGELKQGYPKHLLGVIGHLAEASEECMSMSKELADKIRQYRLLLLENAVDIVFNEKDIDIPYFDLFMEVMQMKKEIGCGNCSKASDDFKERLKNKLK